AHGMAKADAHQSLAEKPNQEYGPVLPGHESLRGWLDRLPARHARAAAFDTRYDKPMLLTGSAAKKVADQLRGKGYSVIDTQSFFVETAGGPLAEGERERAIKWGRGLLHRQTRPSSLTPSLARVSRAAVRPRRIQ